MNGFGLLMAYTTNIGDDIQALAANQYLPWQDAVSDREKLSSFQAPATLKVIMNGWYMHNPKAWPPSDSINPLLISMHISPLAARYMLKGAGKEYLVKYGPVGARDFHTLELLQNAGIESYFSGCLTLTLKNFLEGQEHPPQANNNIEILLIDLEDSLAKRLKSHTTYPVTHLTQLWRGANYTKPSAAFSLAKKVKSLFPPLTREYLSYRLRDRLELNPEHRLAAATERLRRLRNARLVVTSRLHAALPAVSFGTPVIFIHNNPNDVRFGGLIDLTNVLSKEELLANWEHLIKTPPPNPNVDKLHALQQKLEREVRAFTAES